MSKEITRREFMRLTGLTAVAATVPAVVAADPPGLDKQYRGTLGTPPDYVRARKFTEDEIRRLFAVPESMPVDSFCSVYQHKEQSVAGGFFVTDDFATVMKNLRAAHAGGLDRV